MRKKETTVSFFLCLNYNQYYSGANSNKSTDNTISCNGISATLQ